MEILPSWFLNLPTEFLGEDKVLENDVERSRKPQFLFLGFDIADESLRQHQASVHLRAARAFVIALASECYSFS
jgi:hypothetical protein